MTWSLGFRLRRYLRESLWVIPLVGGALGWTLGIASSDLGSLSDFTTRWDYSAATAEAVLAAVVAASVGLVGFVVTVSVLIVQMSTNTFSARYMRIFYRDRAFKAVLAVLIGTFTFSYTLMRHVEEDDVPNLGVTAAGAFLGLGILLFVVFLDRATLSPRVQRRAESLLKLAGSDQLLNVDLLGHAGVACRQGQVLVVREPRG